LGDYRITEKGAYDVRVIAMNYDPDEHFSVLGFPTLDLAIEYARRRTRDSLEEMSGCSKNRGEMGSKWFMFGEDCLVVALGIQGIRRLITL
jgi:hypothetical protein